MRKRVLLLNAALPLGLGASAYGFDAPVTVDPSSIYTATFTSTPGVQSVTRILNADAYNYYAPAPSVYYVKYHSDGNTIAKFDTFGSDFGTGGPAALNPNSFKGAYDLSEIAVYKADGTKVGITKSTVGLDGNPIVKYPRTDSAENQWYVGEGLSEAYFYNNAPVANPHWSASPSDPTYYTGWSAPGNPGNGQKYYQNPAYPSVAAPNPQSGGYYYTNLNEYHVWSTALSNIVLDNNGNPVLDSSGNPRSQPGWRYADYTRTGPATNWNRFSALPAGDYYIAFSNSAPVFAGDTYTIQYLQAPVNFDYDTYQNNQSALDSNGLGTWQYYLDSHGQAAYGTIKLNLTQISSTLVNSSWKSNTGGTWSAAANWSGTAPDGIEQYANFGTFGGTITTPQTVNVAAPLTVGSMLFDNSQSYTVGGSAITLDVLISDRASINVASGSHTISAPLVLNDDTTLNVVQAGSTLNLTGAITSTLKLIEKTGAGTAIVPSLNAFALNVTGGLMKFSAKATANSASGASSVRQLYIAPAGSTVDLTNNSLTVDYNGQGGAPGSPVGDIRGYLHDGKLITSATVGGNSIGYVSNTDLHLSAFAGQSFPANDYSQIFLKFTYGGDANLDSVVNALDFNALAANYGLSSNSFWRQGDFSYDGIVGMADFTILSGNFDRGTFSPLASPSALGSLLPEPGSLALLLTAGGLLMHRSRRRH